MIWFYEKMYDLTRKCTIYRENVWFTEKIDMIYRENVWFNEKMYDLPRKCMIYRENVWFTEKMSWFTEKMSWFTNYSYDFSKILFYYIYNFFNVFLIYMCIFFSVRWQKWKLHMLWPIGIFEMALIISEKVCQSLFHKGL